MLYKYLASLSPHHHHSLSDIYISNLLGDDTTTKLQTIILLTQVRQTFTRIPHHQIFLEHKLQIPQTLKTSLAVKPCKTSSFVNHHHWNLKYSPYVLTLGQHPQLQHTTLFRNHCLLDSNHVEATPFRKPTLGY